MSMAFQCPTCADGELLAEDGGDFRCPLCKQRYPGYAVGDQTLPWLYRRPDAARLGWRNRVSAFRQNNQASQKQLCGKLAKPGLLPETWQRLARRRQALATLDASVSELMDALLPEPTESPLAAVRCNDGLVVSADVLSYRNNLFRDWAWENGETEAMLEAVNEVLALGPAFERGGLGRTLTLGSGAGRLSYDLHRQHQPPRSVLLDMNPLLSALAARIISGSAVEMPEFPIAPLSVDDAARVQRCALPDGAPSAPENLEIVIADALAPPFAAASFDTVLTPWLVDILPLALPDFIPVVNRLLPIGGRWLNTGTLAFAQDDEAHNFAPDELPGLIEAAGFKLQAFTQRSQRYLQSPLSAHGRVEQIYSWHATKVEERAMAPPQSMRPAWLDTPSAPIPVGEHYAFASAHHLLNAQVLGAVDGKRSLQTLSRLLAAKHELDEDTARSAIEAILLSRSTGT